MFVTYLPIYLSIDFLKPYFQQMREELRPKEQKGYVRGTMQDTSVSATHDDTDEVELITLDSSQDEDVIMDQQKEEEDGQVESDSEKNELEVMANIVT